LPNSLLAALTVGPFDDADTLTHMAREGEACTLDVVDTFISVVKSKNNQVKCKTNGVGRGFVVVENIFGLQFLQTKLTIFALILHNSYSTHMHTSWVGMQSPFYLLSLL
jgi:hypothetical protein